MVTWSGNLCSLFGSALSMLQNFFTVDKVSKTFIGHICASFQAPNISEVGIDLSGHFLHSSFEFTWIEVIHGLVEGHWTIPALMLPILQLGRFIKSTCIVGSRVIGGFRNLRRRTKCTHWPNLKAWAFNIFLACLQRHQKDYSNNQSLSKNY